jgi:hypothetical protein
MMLPSSTSGYNVKDRFYVYVKSGETVFWGFHMASGSSSNATWYYDPTSTDFYPSGTTVSTRISVSSAALSSTSTPTNQANAYNGPSQITGSGYTGN